MQNKQTNAREAHIPALPSPSEVTTMLKRLDKHENKEQGKTQHETSRSKKHKTTQSKNYNRTPALERSIKFCLLKQTAAKRAQPIITVIVSMVSPIR